MRRPLSDYLAMQYPFRAVASEEEARQLWIETEYEMGAEIPLPSYPEEYSGRFNLRLPKSLHRALAESAERDGVSLNQYVTGLPPCMRPILAALAAARLAAVQAEDRHPRLGTVVTATYQSLYSQPDT